MTTDADAPLDEAYFEWLYSQVASVNNRNPQRSYWKLFQKLHRTEFTWYVPNDDNRVEDGRELRELFLTSTRYRLDDPHGLFMDLGCSVLEMLIAFAKVAGFDTDRTVTEWFWRYLHNLELDAYSDLVYEISIEEEVEEVLDRLINRTYSPDGNGGLFPLRHPSEDQRTIELLYQLSAYLREDYWVQTRPRW